MMATIDDDPHFEPGTEVRDSAGNAWIVVGEVKPYLGLRRATWWRRLYWRAKRSIDAHPDYPPWWVWIGITAASYGAYRILEVLG